MDYQYKRKLSELIVISFEGQMTDQQRQELNEIVGSSSEAASCYIEFMDMLSCFTKYGTTDVEGFDFDSEGDIDSDFEHAESENYQAVTDSNVSLRGVDLHEFMADEKLDMDEDSDLTVAMLELLEMERTAPTVEIEKPSAVKPERELIQKVESDFKWFPGEGNKAITRAYLALVACIMVFVGYIYFFVPDPIDRPIVATLADSIDAVWDNKLQKPDEFDSMVQSRYCLKAGYASVLFSEGAKVTIEAPAEFSLNSSGDMELFSGKIYAVVPQQAHGFSVKAGGSKIVDLGTEFGVEVDNSGNSQLHVTKGSTMLFAGLIHGKKDQISVDAGSARKVYSDGFVKDIPVAKEKFARIINSKSNLVLREQEINLADIVGGGNGFGTGTLEKGIDMVTARFQMFKGESLKRIETEDFSYKPFTSHRYIDGVCIPNGGAGPVQVSSKGHIFENCPTSEGIIWSGVFNGAFHLSEGRGIPRTQSSLGGTIYGTASNPAVYMTPNQAVTFDLDAIRKDLNGVSIAGFTAKAGLSETLQNYSKQTMPKTSFYVIVDGVSRFEKIDQQVTDDVLDIRVDIRPEDRFLTIMTLQGTDGRTDFECSLFARPSLLLE